MVEFNEPGWITSLPTRSGEIDGVDVAQRISKTSIAVGEISLRRMGRPMSPAEVSPTFTFAGADINSIQVSPRTGAYSPSPQLRLSRSVTNLKKKVRVMGTSFEPTEPLPPPSRDEQGEDRGFFKNLMNRRQSTLGLNLKFNRRGSEPSNKMPTDHQSTIAQPSPVTRPLLAKPMARYEHFTRVRTRPPSIARSVDRPESISGASERASTISNSYTASNRQSIATSNGVIEEEASPSMDEQWVHFVECYAEGRFNISLPPDPPTSNIPGGFLAAPIIADELNRLKAVLACSVPFTERAEEKCRFFIERAQQSFKTKWNYISFIDDEYENFKFEIPFPNIGPVPRTVSLGSHALLTVNEPMVILDASKDWRFAKNPLVSDRCQIRFFAAAPIVNNDGYVVGVFAVADPESRTIFAAPQRRRLMDFARTTMLEIDIIVSEVNSSRRQSLIPSINLPQRQPTRKASDTSDFSRDSMLSATSMRSVDRMRRGSDISGHLSMTTTLTPSSPMFPQGQNGLRRPASVLSLSSYQREQRDSALMMQTPRTAALTQRASMAELPSLAQRSSMAELNSLARRSPHIIEESPTLARHTSIKVASRKPSLPSPIFPSTDRSITPGKTSPAQITNLVETTYALSVMAYSMEFDLVYLLRIRPRSPFLQESELRDENLFTKVLASFGMPNPELSFEPNMHLSALRATNGFLYNNENDPEDDQVGYQTGVILPLVQDKDRRMGAIAAANGQDAPDFSTCRSGILLAAYSFKRQVVDEDMLNQMKELGTGIREVLLKVDGYLDGGMLG